MANQGVSAFYRIWTIREAISKATGEGLALVADGRDRVPVGMVDGVLVAADEGWLVAHEIVQPDVSLALALFIGGGVGTIELPVASLADLRREIPG